MYLLLLFYCFLISLYVNIIFKIINDYNVTFVEQFYIHSKIRGMFRDFS